MAIPFYIRDHEGKRRRLYPISYAWFDRLTRQELAPDVADRVRRRLGDTGNIELRARSVVNVVVSILVYGTLLALMVIKQPWDALRNLVIGAAIGVVILFVMTNVTRWQRRKAIVSAMLVEGRCALCAYDLGTTPIDRRGLTTCPECGAAWIVPDQVMDLISPDDPSYTLYCLGIEAADSGRLSDAWKYFERSLELSPHCKTASRLAEVMERYGRRAEADAMRERAFQMGPQSDQAATECARVLARKGETDRARVILGDVLARNQAYGPATRLLAEIGEGAGDPV